jgi:NTP pyrophosphatase (non-canonical NTP hydrolase)
MQNCILLYIKKMDKKLLDYIQGLSKRDKKNLTSKALKVSEEQGELAKAVLPFESAYACRHRFVDKYKILEEVADTILAAISIAYDLDFSHEDIADMLDEKAQVWQSRQAAEDGANFPLPYEIHITVEKGEDVDQDVFSNKFKTACESIGVKPIVLDLNNSSGDKLKDAMTSSNHHGDNRTAYEEMQVISSKLKRLGYKVVREKIETVPWHPGSPKKQGESMPKNCYFESHIGVLISDSDDDRENLQALAVRVDAHLSKNTFKKVEDGKYIVMLTLRDYHISREEFLSKVEKALAELNIEKWEMPKKEVVEFAIYDTKISHDYLWLK